MEGKIYTHDRAAEIAEIFEGVLDRYGIKVPSPEDGEREDDNEAKLYGSTYSDVLDGVEAVLVETLDEAGAKDYIPYEFSGNY